MKKAVIDCPAFVFVKTQAWPQSKGALGELGAVGEHEAPTNRTCDNHLEDSLKALFSSFRLHLEF